MVGFCVYYFQVNVYTNFWLIECYVWGRGRYQHWLQSWKYGEYYEDIFEIIDKKNIHAYFSKPDGKSEWIRNACLYQSMNRTDSKEQVWENASYGFLEYNCIKENHISIWLVISSQYLNLSEELDKISCSFSADTCVSWHFHSWWASKQKCAIIVQIWNLTFFFY